MGLHILGRKCSICGKKGLIIGADEGVRFRPQGWLLQQLAARKLACPHCGAIMFALTPDALKSLKLTLREDRQTEAITYHARPRRTKKPTP